MPRILVTGRGGMLARAVVAAFESGHEVTAFSKAELDITDAPAVRETIERVAPDILINCAAYTAVDACESDEETANRVNGIAVGYLAAALPRPALLVHVSTDFVFNGSLGRPYREADTPDPLSRYGSSKYLGEKATRSRRGRWLLVRTAWLFGAGGRNFVTAILGKAAAGGPLEVVRDQRGNPTWTDDLAGALRHLVDRDATGVVHAAGAGDTTWFEFARAIVEEAGHDVEVRPIRSSDLGLAADRPTDSRLDCALLTRTGYRMMDWREALRRYLADQPAHRPEARG